MATIKEVLQLLEEDRKGATPNDGIIHASQIEAACTGIMVSFSASITDIELAYKKKCNLILAHEGAYYSHDNQVFLADPVSTYKKSLLEKYGICLYRNHDSVHRSKGDDITKGLVTQLNWQTSILKEGPYYSVIEQSYELQELLIHVSTSLQLNGCRYFGAVDANVNKIALLVGYRGNVANLVEVLEVECPEVIIIGEGPEWEYMEFIKDIFTSPKETSLKAVIVIGHAESEKVGMDYYATNALKTRVTVPVYTGEEVMKPQFFVNSTFSKSNIGD